MQVCNQSRSQRHSSFFPSGRTFQVISNRNFHSKEKIFFRNEVNRHCLGYSSIDQLRHGPLRSNLNTAWHRTVSVLSVARYIARPVSKGKQITSDEALKKLQSELKFLCKHSVRTRYMVVFCRCQEGSCPHCSHLPKPSEAVQFLWNRGGVPFIPNPSPI